MTNMILSCQNLSFVINDQALFKNLSFTILPSGIIYITGANGSGKTTLLRMIAGIQQSDSGNIYLNNIAISEMQKPFAIYIGHKLALKADLTVYQHLEYWAKIYDSVEMLTAAIYYFNLHSILDEKCLNLSAGTQKKVALARLLTCKADLWILDEVESNLDEANRMLLNNLIISKANTGGIILIASHEPKSINSAQILNLGDFYG